MDAAMINGLLALDPRIRDNGRLHHSLTYVSVVSTANTVLLTAPTGATLWLFALMVHNRNAASTFLSIGTGAVLTQVLPRLGPFLQNFHDIVWIPPTHFEGTIYITASAAAAATNDVHVMGYAIAVGGA